MEFGAEERRHWNKWLFHTQCKLPTTALKFIKADIPGNVTGDIWDDVSEVQINIKDKLM